jgi:hypothetical protein
LASQFFDMAFLVEEVRGLARPLKDGLSHALIPYREEAGSKYSDPCALREETPPFDQGP